jgi:hypothetical protein
MIKDEDYIAGTAVVDTTVGMVVELYGIDLRSIESLSDPQRDNFTVLAWVGTEIMSLGAVTALGDGKYRTYWRRGCYGTQKSLHTINTDVWFIYRTHIVPLDHTAFLPQTNVYFKLQSYTRTEVIDLADVPFVSHFFDDGPFLINNLRLDPPAGSANEFVGRNPAFAWDLFDISGLGVVGSPDVVPAVQHTDTNLWHSLEAVGHAEDEITVGVNLTGSITPPAAGAAKVFDIDTGFWYSLTCSGIGPNLVLGIGTTGSSTPPTGGVPIVTNALTGLHYKLLGKGTSTEILFQLDLVSGTWTGPGGSGGQFADIFVRFELRVLDAVTGAVVWHDHELVVRHIFSYEENVLGTGGPRRAFSFEVRAVALLPGGDLYFTPWLGLDVLNPQQRPLPITIHPSFDRIFFHHPATTDLDDRGRIAWRSLDSDFVVEYSGDPPTLDEGVEMVYDGLERNYSIAQDEGTTYYYRYANYDAFSPSDHSTQAFLDDLIISDAFAVSTLTNTPTLPPPSISPGSQNFSGSLNISVTPAESDQTVRYTLDGTDVLPSSMEWPKIDGVYSTLSITTSCVLHARGYRPDGTPTQQAVANYTLVGTVGTCGAVTFQFAGVHHHTGGTMTLLCATAGNTIHYSVNGVEYADYSGPFGIDLDDFVEAYATADLLNPSPITFFDNSSATPPP